MEKSLTTPMIQSRTVHINTPNYRKYRLDSKHDWISSKSHLENLIHFYLTILSTNQITLEYIVRKLSFDLGKL